MSNIFKFYINNNNRFNKVYLFIQNKYLTKNTNIADDKTLEQVILPDVKELNSLYNNYDTFFSSNIYKNYFINDFDENDINYIKSFNSQIFFINNIISNDDTIETIKLKFIQHYNNIVNEDEKICFEEIYMYGLTRYPLNKLELFNKLTNNNKNELTRKNIINHFINIYENNELLNSLENKEVYSFDDFNVLKNNSIGEYIALGQHFTKYISNINFVTNPYNYLDSSIKQMVDFIVTNNSNMLFEYNIYNNNIYICLASDLLKNKENQYQQETIIRLYFAFLYSQNIINESAFMNNKIDLIKKTNILINNENYINKNKFILLLNNIYNDSDNLNYINFGIKSLNFNIYTHINSNISLESLFKLINSSETYPMIKYNPGKKLENIYRFYCDKVIDKKKIPILNKSLIFKYAKFLGKTNTISFYVNTQDELLINDINEFLIEIDDTGTINIKIDLKNIINLNTINTLIANYINNIIKFIKKLSINNNIELFDNLLDKNIEINSITYVSNINIKGAITFKNINNCISYLFNIINNSTNEIDLRYKHVSNFNIMNAEDSFILELIKQKINENEILDKLQENFKLSLEDAKFKLISVINSLKMVQNTFNNKKIKIKNNPGFLTKFKKTSSTNLMVSIENIDNINYLDYLPLYIDSIIKIIFNLVNNATIEKNIKDLCTKKLKVDIINENQIIDIEDREFHNQKINHLLDDEDYDYNNNDLLDILLDDDSNDENSDDDDTTDYNLDEKPQTNYSKMYKKNGKNDEEEKEDEEEKSVVEDEEEKEEEEKEEEEKEEEDEEEDFELVKEIDIQDKKTEKQMTPPLKKNKQKFKIEDQDINEFQKNEKEQEEKEDSFKEISEKSNPILKRLINKEPKLFSTDKNKFFTEYSRLCPANIKKQPVILTKEEKDYIDNNHRDSYTESYEYGTKDGNKYYYICPRYWDLEKNISLTHQEVSSGKYGKVITKKNKDGTFDGNIMEFTDNKYHKDEKGNYIDHVPGFLDEKHNRDGFCLPCCFNHKLWNKPQQQQRRNKCLNLDHKIKSDIKKDYYNYIKGPEKFPLEKNKIGFLPISIQKFLQFDNLNCVTKQAENLLKTNYPCLLRYGVENDTNQSFIACIADLYSTIILNNTKSLSISEMKNIIKNSINVDNFIQYNNGNLPQIFISKNFYEIIDSINIDKYKNSNLYNSIIVNTEKKSDENKIILFKKIINSFENFKKYLESNLFINYTYLWDIICKSNPLLFPNGLNLIILDITNEDITDNVKIVCPKQNYSNEFLDIKKKCFLLIKKDEYYEPIYLINNTVDYYITKVFSLSISIDNDNLKNFKLILNKIKNAININCIGKIDNKKYIESTYNFKKNIELDKTINILIGLKYDVNYQIIDYNNKIIGVLISNDKEHGFIPCYPSALSVVYNNIPYKLIDSLKENDYNNYNNTKNLLEKIYNLSNHKIICKPLYKIIDDNTIIGILTLGNQFVMISKPTINISDELEELNDKNYIFIDKKIQTSNSEDNERVETINNIKLETQFYNSFKNTFKKIINMQINKNYKNILLKIINNNSILYLDKLTNIYNLLKNIGENYIIFSKYDKKILQKIKKVSTCIDGDECDTDFCMKTNDICSLIIPNINLINNESNEEIYYTRLADEFLRYNKFKNYIFEDNVSFSYGSIDYNILHNELLIFHSSLTQDYFKNITNNNISNDLINTFDTTGFYEVDKLFKIEDIKKENKEKLIIETTKNTLKDIQEYAKKYNMDTINETQVNIDNETEEIMNNDDEKFIDNDDIENYNIQLLLKNIDTNYQCNYYKNIIKDGFHLNFKEPIYEVAFSIENKICSFQLILLLIKYHYKDKTDKYNNYAINDLKKKLFSLYIEHPNLEALYYILFKNNKKLIMEKVINNEITFENLLYSDEYYITYIDLYLLSKEFNLPIILLCNSNIDLGITSENYIICNLNRQNNNYYFIKIPSKYSRKKIHNYKLIYNKTSFMINLDDDLLDNTNYPLYSKLINEIKLFIDPIEKFISNYDLINATKSKYVKKQKFQVKQDQKVTTQEKNVKRCPNGTRKNKITGKCEKIGEEPLQEEEVIEEPLQEEEEDIKSNTTKKLKRCPNGTRRNKKTGECEKI